MRLATVMLACACGGIPMALAVLRAHRFTDLQVGANQCWHKRSTFKAHLYHVYQMLKMVRSGTGCSGLGLRSLSQGRGPRYGLSAPQRDSKCLVTSFPHPLHCPTLCVPVGPRRPPYPPALCLPCASGAKTTPCAAAASSTVPTATRTSTWPFSRRRRTDVPG